MLTQNDRNHLWLFSLPNVPSTNMEKAWFKTYCSQPPGGNPDTLASLLGSHHVVHLYIQSTIWNPKQIPAFTHEHTDSYSHTMFLKPHTPGLRVSTQYLRYMYYRFNDAGFLLKVAFYSTCFCFLSPGSYFSGIHFYRSGFSQIFRRTVGGQKLKLLVWV